MANIFKLALLNDERYTQLCVNCLNVGPVFCHHKMVMPLEWIRNDDYRVKCSEREIHEIHVYENGGSLRNLISEKASTL